ncbi:MAG: helix-turn-helix transcriptional regulator [Bacillota bacterium]|jgi:transcriptional regulator with XRE-family HTH domain
MMVSEKEFGIRLKKLRLEKKNSNPSITQRELADFLNLTIPAYGFYEQGRNFPNIEVLAKIADYFDVTIDYLVGRTDEKR